MDRRGYLGGSDIGVIFGVSQWKTAYELWVEKTAEEFAVPEVEPQREKLYKRGKRLEPVVIEMLEEERGITVLRRNQRYQDPELSWAWAEIDFEYADDMEPDICNGDVKTIHPFAAGEWGDEGTDQFPTHYCLQFMWGLMVTGRSMCLVAALIGADDLRIYQVRRDDELIAEMRRRASEFWTKNILAKVPPPPQNVQDTQKMLQRVGDFVSPGCEEVWEAIRRMKGFKEAAKRLNHKEEEQKLIVHKRLLEEAEAMTLKGPPKQFVVNDASGKKLATLSMQNRKAYTVKESSFMVLRIA